jgi:DNA-binding NtrC family response regulator
MPGAPVLLGESVAVRRLRSQIRRIAPYFRVALIRGEPGSGKDLVARALHAGSAAAEGPFIETQAVAVSEPFAPGEARRAAFIGAVASLPGAAHAGTLYLTGVGELSVRQQAGLLRFLRSCEQRRAAPPHARPAGSRAPALRILAASERDLRGLAAIGQFRQDLYAQLSAVEILVPPLRERLDDIPILAEYLLVRLAAASGRVAKLLAEATVAQLQRARWPENLRQLERVLGYAAGLAEGAWIEPRHLLSLVEPGFAPAAETVNLERLHDVIHRHVLDVLRRCGGNKLRAAEMLGISRSTLYRMLDARPTPMQLPQ